MKDTKIQILNKEGTPAAQIEMPDFFSAQIRDDIILRAYLASLHKQPHAPNILAGMKHSASGKLRHIRHKWKTLYGYGISRVPRKIHTRRGSRFMWVGATISSAVGGRQAHPPKVESMTGKSKINSREKRLAMLSALAATASQEKISARYSRIAQLNLAIPVIFDSSVISLKSKEISKLLQKVLGENFAVALRDRAVRAGKGKARGRKYKSARGLLFVTASDEKMKCREFETAKAGNLSLEQLAPSGVPGRLVAYTEKAVSELKNKYGAAK
ncbi:MAG: 50S ribosomal protein L4 [archaeon]